MGRVRRRTINRFSARSCDGDRDRDRGRTAYHLPVPVLGIRSRGDGDNNLLDDSVSNGYVRPGERVGSGIIVSRNGRRPHNPLMLALFYLLILDPNGKKNLSRTGFKRKRGHVCVPFPAQLYS